MTASEYLAWEREQAGKHEYFAGEIFAMAGGSPRHNALVSAVIIRLGNAFAGGHCRIFPSDQRLAPPGHDRYVYADASVVCGGIQLQPGTTDVVTNPSIVVEVLSRKTEQYDRGLKWEGYRSIPMLTDYLLMSQQAARIEHFQRQADGSWRYRVVEAGERVTLSTGVMLDVDSVFEGVFELASDE